MAYQKWIIYGSNTRIMKCSSRFVAKPRPTLKKVMLCLVDWKGFVHYKLLLPRNTIDFDAYYQQLIRLKQATEKSRPEVMNRRGVILYHNDVRLHTYLASRQKLRKFR